MPEIVAPQEREHQSSLEGLEANLGIARQQLTQRNQEYKEVQVGRDQAARSYRLAAVVCGDKALGELGGSFRGRSSCVSSGTWNRFRGERDQASAQLVRLPVHDLRGEQKN
ncbi:MAG: hypothetical protein R3E33_02300 [Rhodocyclaceae bacterium]